MALLTAVAEGKYTNTLKTAVWFSSEHAAKTIAVAGLQAELILLFLQTVA